MAADRDGSSQSRGLLARVTQRIRRSLRFGDSHSREASAVPRGPSTAINFGELAAAQLVHDLRNQLTIMLGCVDNVAEVVLTGEADQEIAELRQCVERALLLTGELLIAARPRSATRGPVDLNRVVASAVERLSPIMADRIDLRLRLSPVTIPIVAEPLELERIVVNLAFNACDAMAGEGVLTIETAAAYGEASGHVESTLRRPHARLTVSDTGHGMTPEVKARIFEPFFTTKENGTGLGLSSVAFTVRQLHGTILVDSQPGGGTFVSVILPLHNVSHR
jgi:two-component system, cell cycle sensor histidine kinase and response regulator CckA